MLNNEYMMSAGKGIDHELQGDVFFTKEQGMLVLVTALNTPKIYNIC